MWRVVLLSCGILAFAVPGFADTYVVHPDGTGDFPTIQAAIGACIDGDVVELTDGVFTGEGNRDIDFLGKAITVRSQSGDPETCITNCEGSQAEPHRAFHFHSGEAAGSVLEGVTATGGYAHVPGLPSESSGGAIRCYRSSPTITNCAFSQNHSTSRGGGVFCQESSPAISACTFRANSAENGAGLGCYYSAPLITECVFEGNNGAYHGGAVHCGAASPHLSSCTFVENTALNYGGAIYAGGGSNPAVRNCTLSGNSAPEGGGIYNSPQNGVNLFLFDNVIAFNVGEGVGGPYVNLFCCNLFGNTGGDWVGYIADQYGQEGNICQDPCFCGGQNPNAPFKLHSDSPCLPFTPPNEECDLVGAWPIGCGTFVVRPDGMGHFPTVQAAIDAAVEGVIVALTDGIFTGHGNRDLDFLGKGITVRSQNDNPDSCIIDCEGSAAAPHRGFIFQSGEGPGSMLIGVSVVRGYASDCGGALHVIESAPTISTCVFGGNMAPEGGAAFCSGQPSPSFSTCTFAGNTGISGGGFLSVSATPEFSGCAFIENAAITGGGLHLEASSHASLVNTIIAFGSQGLSIRCDGGSSATLSCCDVFGNAGGDYVGCIAGQEGQNGNICQDPLFCDADAGNYRLREDSPCAPFTPPNEECDLIGAWPVGCAPMGLPDHHPLGPSRPLLLAAPNPFMGSTHITFDVPGDASDPVRLSIHDLSGRRVRILDSTILAGGLHGIVWDGLDQCGNRIGSGIYFARLQVGEQSLIRRLTLLR